MKLYELTQNYLNLLDLLDNPEVPKEIIENALEEVEGTFEDKAENIVKLIRSVEAEVKAYKDEEDRLSTRRKTLENKVISLKGYLESSLKTIGKQEIKGKLFTLKIQKNAPSVVIDDVNTIPKKYLEVVEKVDKKKIKEDLKNGLEIPGVKLEATESLRIR